MTLSLKLELQIFFGRNKITGYTVPVACFINNHVTYGNCLAVSVSEPSCLLFTFQSYSAQSSLTQLQLSKSVKLQ